ncbi:DUF1368 domain-containing protein [Bacillus mycoides]|uniref:DUF1368 domain-containing protein n=1 Tax=Bacillus mycoides TaxID=1405 RepID=UPI003D65DED4
MNFYNIPKDIKESNQFCFWKCVPSIDIRQKPLKKPYGFCKKTKKIIPSLKESNYWLDWSSLLSLFPKLTGGDWGIGLILNNTSYVAIDLDDCLVVKDNKVVLFEEVKQLLALFPGAYSEISPSNTGLHIIFKGTWLTNQNKSKIYLIDSLKKGKIEVYSGNDCRYITLTGNLIDRNFFISSLPFYSFESESLQKIYSKFFIKKNSDGDQPKYFLANLHSQYQSIRFKILESNYSETYLNLCNFVNPSYKSASEADWSYLNIVFKFLEAAQFYQEKYFLLKYFYRKDRPYRNKKDRFDYFDRTITKVLSSSVKTNNSSKGIASSSENLGYTFISKNVVLRVCNIMRIFHFGKSVQNFQYVYKSPNNYIKATNPLSLNQNDFVNYIAILQQFSEHMNSQSSLISENDYIEINVRKILQSLGKQDSGRSYERFINIVKKLAHTTIEYDKQIHINGLRSKKVGNLLMYEYKYNKSVSNHIYKKLFVKMHPSIIDILTEAKYNYSIFNYQSFLDIDSNELKLLYYYFCLSTLPGSYMYNFSFNDLLQFWPISKNRSTLFKRKQILHDLLDQFCYIQDRIPIRDIKIVLKKKENTVVNVLVKKRQFRLS